MLNNTNQSWLQGLNEFIDGKEPWFQRQQKRLDNSQGNHIGNRLLIADNQETMPLAS